MIPRAGAIGPWTSRVAVIDVTRPILLLLVLGLQGCYSAVRVDPSAVQPGENLSLHLDDEGVDRLARLSAREGEEIAGQLQSLTSDSITISALLRQPSATGMDAGRLRQALTFSLADVREVTVPQLNKGRTAGIVIGAAVLVGYVLADVLNFGSVDTRTPEPGEPSPYLAPGR